MRVTFLLSLLFATFYSATGIAGGAPATWDEGAKGVALIDAGFEFALPPYCMGALITSQMVLTAAMCCNYHDLLPATVHVGSLKPFETGQFYHVAKRKIFGRGSQEMFKLCILKLVREVQLNAHCAPVGLPAETNFMNDSSQALKAFGFGSTFLDPPEDPAERAILNYNYERVLHHELMSLEMPRVERRFCREFYESDPGDSYDVHCIGYTADRLKRLMYDDHGAPLIGTKDNTLYAIMLTYPRLKSRKTNIKKNSVQFWGIDVRSAKADILLTIKALMEDEYEENGFDP